MSFGGLVPWFIIGTVEKRFLTTKTFLNFVPLPSFLLALGKWSFSDTTAEPGTKWGMPEFMRKFTRVNCTFEKCGLLRPVFGRAYTLHTVS